ncbi:MAG: alternative ribosome rescue aminoacyl-tRNA hydrolase ArfB [Polyangiaceae bacterium]
MATDLYVDDGLVIPGDELSWHAVRASGPGGQNVNKVSTKVILRFDVRGSRVLSPAIKARLLKIAAGRLDAEGWVVMRSQQTRNRIRNLEDARERLAELIRRAKHVPKRRRPTKPTRGSQRRRVEGKRRKSDKKRDRKKVSY